MRTLHLPKGVVLPNFPEDWLVEWMTGWDNLVAPKISRLIDRHGAGITVDRSMIVYTHWSRAYDVMPKSNEEFRRRTAARSGYEYCDPDPAFNQVAADDLADRGLQILPRYLWDMCVRASRVTWGGDLLARVRRPLLRELEDLDRLDLNTDAITSDYEFFNVALHRVLVEGILFLSIQNMRTND